MKSKNLFWLSWLVFFFSAFSYKSLSQTNKQYTILVVGENGQQLSHAKVIAALGEELSADQSGKIIYKKYWAPNVTVKALNYYPKKVNLQVHPLGSTITVTMKLLPPEFKAINVYVKDKDNKPINEAVVLIIPGESGVTNVNGYAKAGHSQQPGEYIVVRVQASGYKDQQKRILVGAAQGTGITRPDEVEYFILEKGENERNVFSIVVEVLDHESDQPVSGSSVKLKLSDGYEYTGVTNTNGEATLREIDFGFQGTTGRVIVTHPEYQEKWSDITEDLMTAKDRSERQFLMYVKKKDNTGPCKLQGTWTQDTPGIGSTDWIIESDGTAIEKGIGYAEGKATLSGNVLHIDWKTRTGYSGYYEWTLGDNCSSVKGTLVFKTGRTDNFKSTVKRKL